MNPSTNQPTPSGSFGQPQGQPLPVQSGVSTPVHQQMDALVQTAAADNAASQTVSSEDGVSELTSQTIAQAKTIIQQTQASPFQRSQALQKLRADYVAKRYHTNIKLTQN